MMRDCPKTVLLSPPITDPTTPYHSLVYVASFARACGFEDITLRDTNIEALHYCANPDLLRVRKRVWQARWETLNACTSLTQAQQLEYGFLLNAILGLDPESPSKAIQTLQDPERFFHFPTYRGAVRDLLFWMDCLSCDGFPGQFRKGFSLSSESLFSLSSLADLTDPDLLGRCVGPFQDYFLKELLPSLQSANYQVVGINITYTSQLPYALWLLGQIRQALPDAYLVCGGTEVSDVWKYASTPDVFRKLFREADACVLGEGESTFVRILESLEAGQRPSPSANLVLLRDGLSKLPGRPPITYEDLRKQPTPDYSLLPSDPYFSPYSFVYYSPTRGCYWNKCTFCDYGLNFGSPTSPWRQMPVEQIVNDLRLIAQHTEFVYLSVDVLAPSAILQLAQAIVDAGISLRWGAEIRLERYFTPERCLLLRRSGCVGVSVGFESGSQRILDAIQKGTRLDYIEQTLRSFAEAGIAVQMMGFTGFPTETYEEALESIAYLQKNRDYWTVAGLGSFVLTPGAMIAQNPAAFQITEVRSLEGDDIRRVLTYRELPDTAETKALDEAKKALDEHEFDRPFAPGIDCAHSLFYYSRYGRAFPAQIDAEAQAISANGLGNGKTDGMRGGMMDAIVVLNGNLIPHLRYEVSRFFGSTDLVDLHTQSRRQAGRSLDSRRLRSLLQNPAENALPVTQRNPCFRRSDGLFFACSYEVFHLLRLVDGCRSLSAILADRLADLDKRADKTEDEDPWLWNLAAFSILHLSMVICTL